MLLTWGLILFSLIPVLHKLDKGACAVLALCSLLYKASQPAEETSK